MENIDNLIDEILTYFNLGNSLKNKLLEGGMGNTNYLVTTTTQKRYVVRILKTQTKEGLINELYIQNKLKEAGVGSSYFIFNERTS